MKALLVSLVAVAAGATAGAIGVGTYTALTTEPPVAHAVVPETDRASAGASATPGEPSPMASPEVAVPGEEDRSGVSGTAITASRGPGDSSDDLGTRVDDVGSTTPERSPDALSPSEPRPGVSREPDPDSLARLSEDFQRLARIFAAMKPDEAAPVLAQLEDHELEGILLAMQGRNAAPILAEMDPERAARVSRRVLRGNRED